MKYYEITITTSHGLSDIVAETLIEAGSKGVAVEDPEDVRELIREKRGWDYIDEGLTEAANGDPDVKVRGFFYNPEIFFEIKKELEFLKTLNPGATLRADITEKDDEDYINEWKKYYKPITVKNIVIVPEWMSAPKNGKTPVFIDPHRAFGTGSHATTRMCVGLMQEVDLMGATVFDVGSGSGILAICALKLGAARAAMFDLDPDAVENSRKNTARNGETERAEFFVGSLLEKADGRADVIFANLTADILIELSKCVMPFLKDGGSIILSGIIEKRAKEIKSLYVSLGLTLKKESRRDGWHALLFRK